MKRNVAVIILYNKEKKILLQHRSETHGTKYVFIEEYNPTNKLVLHEGKAMSWKTIAETKELRIVDHDREVLEKIKESF